MRKLFFTVFCGLFMMSQAYALLSMELTRGMTGAVPIAIVPFAVEGQTPSQDVAAIISNDLKNSGRFKIFGGDQITSFPNNASDVQYDYFRRLGADNLVVGKIQEVGGDRYQVQFQLLDVFKGKNAAQSGQQPILMTQKFTVSGSQLRALSHHISDLIYQQITGVKGIFSTRLAYVVVQRAPDGTRYSLEVSDQDGYSPKPLLSSTDPIMSPDWSPDGKQIAYVSFENKQAAIYVQDVATGGRRLISQFPGINGAPSWSPDGRKLALVLSKSDSPNQKGSPSIYIMDVASHQLTRLTKDFYINTEPSWSPDGRKIIFTSDRSGKAQIYQIDLASRAISRVSYDGKYNARGSYTPDGNHIVMINQGGGMYNIGILDLDSGTLRILTNADTDHGSPSMAPNGSMVLFETVYNGRTVLGMSATDGSVQIRLPVRNGEVQDPAWSPFLS